MNLQAGGVKTWLVKEALVNLSKKPSKIVYSVLFEHGNALLVWVKYMVNYVHICIKFLMHDKLVW